MLSLVEVDDEDDDEEEEEEEDDDDWARRLITFGVCARLEGITRPIYGNPTCVCMSFIRWMVMGWWLMCSIPSWLSPFFVRA